MDSWTLYFYKIGRPVARLATSADLIDRNNTYPASFPAISPKVYTTCTYCITNAIPGTARTYLFYMGACV